ncbi:hypothetical protein BDF19DRAFT_416382 [Syncephalis fuscata]|nr:hypothetical protein BDF19DRAFT_416382 [Syncephalis fuscata]
MDIFDLVESLASKNRHGGLPPNHPNHPSQRQSPQVLNPDYDDTGPYIPLPPAGRRGVHFSGSAANGASTAGANNHANIPSVNVNLYNENGNNMHNGGGPPNSRRNHREGDSSFFQRFRGSPNGSRNPSPERSIGENGEHGMRYLTSTATRPRKRSEPNLLHPSGRARSGSQWSEMIRLPLEGGITRDINDNHQSIPLSGFDNSGFGGGGNSVYQHGNSHRRTSSQSNVADLNVPPPVMPVPTGPKPQEKDRKVSKTQNIFKLRRRPKDVEVPPTDSNIANSNGNRRWGNELGLDTEAIYNTYEDSSSTSSRHSRLGVHEMHPTMTMLRKRQSMIRVDPMGIAINAGNMPAMGLDTFQDMPPLRKASVAHTEAMIRAPSAYHHEPTDPNTSYSGKSQEKQYCIRVFRLDGTFATVTCGLGTTTAELCQIVARKFFLTDTSRYVMVLRRHNLERVLGAHEHPAFLQKRWLEQAGYTEADNLSDHGREDNSYLFQYMFAEPPSHIGLPVPKDADIDPTAARHFDFQARNLPTIPKSFFRYAAGIITLNLSQNHSLSLPIEFAQQCDQLRELRLANNDYKSVPEAVRHLATLSHLDLSCNRLAELDHAQLDQVQPLTSLMLQNNRLTELPPSFGRFVSLTSLYLSNNRFNHVPRVICEIRSLTDLDLSFNKISTIPNEIGQLTKLQRLLLVSNRITGTLPRTFDQLIELRELDLRQNGIQDLGVLASMCNLNLLFLDYNTVSTLTCEFRSLQRLTLHKNHLTSFKPSAMPTTSLTSLDLSKSKLPQLPDAMFEQLPMLERLVLDDNNCTNNLLASLPTEIYHLEYLSTLTFTAITWNVSPRDLTFPDPPAPGQKPPPPLSHTMNPALLSAGGGPGGMATAQTLVAGNSSTTSVSSSLSNSSVPVSMRQSSSSGSSLASSLRHLLLGDNGLTDDVFSPLAHFTELRTLNLSFNDIYDIPSGGLYHHPSLVHLHLSGNQITSLPAEEVGRLRSLRELFVNGNKLHALPAELGKIVRLQVLDVGSNEWNLELKYLNLSNNKRLEIKVNRHDIAIRNRNLTDFSTLHNLRVLGLMDITLMVTPPDQMHDRRIRTSASEVNYMSYGMADTLGRSDMLCAWDLVVPKFRGNEDECLFALFDGLEDAMKRAFLNVNKDLGAVDVAEPRTGAAALVIYIVGTRLYSANVGDTLAVLARQRCDAIPLSMKHTPWLPDEVARIQAAGGYVSHQVDLSDDDEFVILASKSLWNRMSYQTAVDVARTESDDLMLAAQKLRDFAISYGADESIMVMVIGVGDLFDSRLQNRRMVNSRQQQYKPGAMHFGLVDTTSTEEIRTGVKKNRRKENLPGDSTLRRLQQEVEAPKGQVALSAIKTHNEIMRRYLRNIGGYEVKTEGDAFMLQLLQADWPQEILDADDGKEVYWETEDGERELIYRGLSVRMGVHWGSPVCEEDPITRRMDYFGPMVNRSARISGVADGGQICISQDVISQIMMVNELIDSEELLDSVQKDLRRQALALRKLGFVFIGIGERKLKGLEGAEVLSLIYPQALRRRWDFTDISNNGTKGSSSNEPTAVQILDPDTVRQLGFFCLRLERITSGTVISLKRKSRIDYLNGLLTFHVKDNAEDEELLRITENLITRIENATSTLYLNRIEGYADVLDDISQRVDKETSNVLQSIMALLGRGTLPFNPSNTSSTSWISNEENEEDEPSAIMDSYADINDEEEEEEEEEYN